MFCIANKQGLTIAHEIVTLPSSVMIANLQSLIKGDAVRVTIVRSGYTHTTWARYISHWKDGKGTVYVNLAECLPTGGPLGSPVTYSVPTHMINMTHAFYNISDGKLHVELPPENHLTARDLERSQYDQA